MFKFNDYYIVNESGGSKLNTHLEHLEDELLNFGHQGAERIINFISGLKSSLEGHSDQAYNITTKWDGAPAIICGRDPSDGRFFVGTKSVGNVNKPIRIKMIHVGDAFGHPWMTKREIGSRGDNLEKLGFDLYVDEKKKKRKTATQLFKDQGRRVLDISYWYDEQAGLKEKIQLAWEHLRHLNITDFMLQGDLLYTPGSIKQVTIPDQSGNPIEYIKFRANTITYAVPLDSNFAKKLLKSKIGIVFHTMYIGDDWNDLRTQFDFDKSLIDAEDQGDPDAPGILHKGIWFDDANFKDVSGQVNLTAEETEMLNNKLSTVLDYHRKSGDVYKFLKGDACKNLSGEMKIHINAIIREQGGFVEDPSSWAQQFMTRYTEKTEKVIAGLKTEAGQTRRRNDLQACVNFIRQNWDDVLKFYSLYLLVIDMKLILMNKLNRLKMLTDTFVENEDGTFSVTEPEGYVAVDHDGSAVKIVDRLGFSRLNFQPKKFG